MGLDNIPFKYPCDTAGTSVRTARLSKDGTPLINEDGQPITFIDCTETQKCGGCPWKKDLEASGLLGGQVYGMLGTDCWYRGKYGNYLLEALDINDDDYNFYGDNEDGTYKSPPSCDELADIMAGRRQEHGRVYIDGEEVTQEVEYAEWYLRWASDKCGGLTCWY